MAYVCMVFHTHSPLRPLVDSIMSLRSASFLLLFVLIWSSFSNAAGQVSPPRPIRRRAVVAPVTRDPATLQHVIEIEQKTPLQKERLILDITGDIMWMACRNRSYKSSTYSQEHCSSPVCSAIESHGCMWSDCDGPPDPQCANNTCFVDAVNTVTGIRAVGTLWRDVLALSSTDGKNPGRKVILGSPFICPHRFLLKGLAKGAVGMAGLSRSEFALPILLTPLPFTRKFALCLAAGSGPGVAFFGAAPYVFLPGIDISQRLAYTPLVANPKFPNEYFITVKAIRVGEKNVALKSAKLKIDSKGKGGTKLSTVVPYTTVATSVYTAIRDAFVKETKAMNIARVARVKPFDACFDAKTVLSTRVGPGVPTIDLVLQDGQTIWRIMGTNSLVQVSDRVLCLGFVDGGEDPTTTIVIGGHQIEDNLVEFDLYGSRLGFSSTLLGVSTTCSNFNFTSTL